MVLPGQKKNSGAMRSAAARLKKAAALETLV
jgi:hypothetical protein